MGEHVGPLGVEADPRPQGKLTHFGGVCRQQRAIPTRE